MTAMCVCRIASSFANTFMYSSIRRTAEEEMDGSPSKGVIHLGMLEKGLKLLINLAFFLPHPTLHHASPVEDTHA